MKVCRKCKIEYKDDYAFCPKCGTPYEDSVKKAKIPYESSNNATNIIKKIVNIFLYVFGGLLIVACLASIGDDFLSSVVGMLFGLSLFQVFYKIVENKTSIELKYLKIARVIIPIVLLIAFGIVSPGDVDNNKDVSRVLTCVYETNDIDEDDGITSRINYNVIFENSNDVHEESFNRYVFKNNDLAYKYYKNHINELKSYNNEVHLINNVMNIFKYNKELKKEGISASVSLYEGSGSICKTNEKTDLKKFNSLKKEFQKEKEQSEQYVSEKAKTEATEKSESKKVKTEEKKSNAQAKKQDNYMDALRKCSVMEAADIYTTGIGQKSDNVFNDGRATCESFYEQFGEKDFIETVNIDWKNRKNEKIDGKTLEYYLGILNW